MIISDFVECEGCGAQIEHIGTQTTILDANRNDPDYRLCESCIAKRDEHYDEPDHDDTVRCCPDCERPNQFGELCVECARERKEQPY